MNHITAKNSCIIALVGLGCMLSVLRFGWSPTTLLLCLFILFAVQIAVTDIRKRVITNKSLLLLLGLGIPLIIFDGFAFSLIAGILGSVVGGSLFLVAYCAGGGIGAGDVKYLFVIGFLLGYPYIVYALGALFISLSGWTLWKTLHGEKILKKRVALAPFISFGFVTALLVSNKT